MGGRERKARKPPRLGELRRGRLRGSSGQAEEGAERSAAPHGPRRVRPGVCPLNQAVALRQFQAHPET